ncbi:MAG: tetratricopeptide repeat protein [Ilumatobacteraceae bacterium]
MNCGRAGCNGAIQDGYCDDCGLAPATTGESQTEIRAVGVPGPAPSTIGRPHTTSTAAVRRPRLGAGLVDIPAIPTRDPATVVMADPTVVEHRRFCSRCDEPVGRSRDGRPGRTAGFCRSCGSPFSFVATLRPGEVVAGQYEVAGCLAHGGLGWIYLARDHNVSERWVVLKGLLDTTDAHAIAAALAERQFLAEVEHPNIVKIHNFVEHGGDGYIVMEYVNGVSLRAILDDRRTANGGRPDPLPVAQAIAFCLELLPALGHLHDLGLVFCDFKPDNVIQSSGTLKLIDLGGVYRVDDRTSPVYGTTGFQAPEIATTGPTVASDLFTVARTLAVLCTDFVGYQSVYRFTLPPARDVPTFVQFESLHAFLERATAADPAERFQSADEMAAQLVGVLREVVATTTGHAAPGPSTMFTPPPPTGSAASVDLPGGWSLPTPLVDPDDPQAGAILALGLVRNDEVVRRLERTRGQSVETDLWLARALIDQYRTADAEAVLDSVDAARPGDWRTSWYRALGALGAGRTSEASSRFRSLHRLLPGELAPKLALGVTAEIGGDHASAGGWYEIVSRTDPSFTSAAFGLARCRLAGGDRAAAVAAYERVLPTSSAHVLAKVAEVDVLLSGDPRPSALDDVRRAATIVEQLSLDREAEARLTLRVLDAAFDVVLDSAPVDPGTTVLGCPLTERDLRVGLERTCRSLARHAATGSERVDLVDRANRVRPRTWR